jgi:hypothetical protein
MHINNLKTHFKKRKERLPVSEEKGEGGSRKKKPKGALLF